MLTCNAGPKNLRAIYKCLFGNKIKDLKPSVAIAQVDSRSEKVIALLQPDVRPVVRAFIPKAGAAGINIKIISGLRTYPSRMLYMQGSPQNLVE